MECLYCGATLGLLSRGEFCNKKHREQFQQQQTELSIQRLVDAFGYEKAGAETPKAGSLSVLDRASKDSTPPPELFAHREERRETKSPAPPAMREAPTAPAVPTKRKGFSPGSDSDRPAPPDAGFIPTKDLKQGLHLPVFNRRPTLSEKGVHDDFESNPFTRFVRSVDARFEQVEFTPALGAPSTDGSPARISGHSAPRPSLPDDEQVSRTLQVQLRNLATEVCVMPAQPVQVCAPQLETPHAFALNYSEQPPRYNVRPAAVPHREMLPIWVASPIAGMGGAALPRISSPQPQPAAWRGASAFVIGRLPSPPAYCGFQALSADSTVCAPLGQLADSGGGSDKIAAKTTQAPMRLLQFPACEMVYPELCLVEPEPQRSTPRVPVAADHIYEVRLQVPNNRELECLAMFAHDPKPVQSRLRRFTVPQPASYTDTPRTFALALTRLNPALAGCTFYPLMSAQIASARARSLLTHHSDLPQQLPLLQIHRRQSELRGSPTFFRIAAHARIAEKLQPVQGLAKRKFEFSPTVLPQRAIREQAASFVEFPEPRPASFQPQTTLRPETHFRAKALQAAANLIGRVSSALFDRIVQAREIPQDTPVRTMPATSPSVASQRPNFRWKLPNDRSLRVEFQAVRIPAAIQAVAIPAENRQRILLCPSEHKYEQRPMSLHRRTVECPPVVAGLWQITFARPSRPAAPRPSAAVTARRLPALPVTACTFTRALPICTFQALRGLPEAAVRAKCTVKLCPGSRVTFQAQPVSIRQRPLEFRTDQGVTNCSTQLLAHTNEAPKTKMDAAIRQFHEIRPALSARKLAVLPTFVYGFDDIPLLARQTSASRPSAALIAAKACGIGHWRPAAELHNSSFHTLATGFVAAPAHARTATAELGRKGKAFPIDARSLRLQAIVSRPSFDFAEPKPASRRPEIGIPSGEQRIAALYRRVPRWSSEWTLRPQIPARLIPSEAARPEPRLSTAGTLHMKLPARKSAAIAYGATASNSPTAAKRELAWVARKVPWAPMP